MTALLTKPPVKPIGRHNVTHTRRQPDTQVCRLGEVDIRHNPMTGILVMLNPYPATHKGPHWVTLLQGQDGNYRAFGAVMHGQLPIDRHWPTSPDVTYPVLSNHDVQGNLVPVMGDSGLR